MSQLSWGLAQGLQPRDGHTPTSVRTGLVGRKIQTEEVAPERRTVGGLGVGSGTDCQDRVRARPVKREFVLEYLGVGVRLHTLADGRGRIVHLCATTRSEVECWTQRVGEGGVSAVKTGNGEGVVCADNVVRALLPVGGQVAIGQVVTRQTLVSHDTSAVENRQGEPRESAHVDLVGCQIRRRADGIVVSEFYVGQMHVPIVLSLVDDHSRHLGHSVVYPLNAPVRVGMIGACSKLLHTQQLIYSLRKLGEELQSVVREYGARAPPQVDVLVYQDIGCTLHGELSGSDGERVGPTTEAIGEQQDVGVALWCDRKGPKKSTLTAIPEPSGRGIEMTGQRTVSRGVFRAWHFKHWRSHHRVRTIMPIHQ